MEKLKTIKRECSVEFEEKKSKFIASVKPVFSKEEAEEYINYIKSLHPNATHNCSAYKINNKGLEFFKVDDDGEPSGTAGKPMGDIINYMEVTNLVVIAAGGLVRNYAKTAKLGITEAEIIDFVNKVDLLFEIPYEKLGEIEKLLKDYEAEVIDKSFLEKIIFKVRINEEFLTNLENYPYINLIDS